MALASLGSIATKILNRVDNVTTSVSGALVDIVDEERLYMEEYTGLTIGSVSIAEKYQPALTEFATAKVLELIQVEDGAITSKSIGDFSVTKSASNPTTAAAKALRESAMEKLKALGKTMRFRQVIS